MNEKGHYMEPFNYARGLILFLVCTLLACCTKPEEEVPSYPVKLAQAKLLDVPYIINSVGTLSCSLNADIKAQVSGILTEVSVKEGEKVQEGELLMKIDPRPYEAEVKAAVANLEENKAKLAYAENLAKTYGTLANKNYVSRLQHEEALQNVEIIKATINADEAHIESAKINLEFTQIHAPFEGYAGLPALDPGNLILVDGKTILLTIRKITPITAAFYVPSKYLYKIQQLQKKYPLSFKAFLAGEKEHPLIGEVTFIDNVVSTATGMVKLQGKIPNEEERGWPGECVNVSLLLETLPDKVVVPSTAVKLGQGGHYLFVADATDKSVQKRNVSIGIVRENQTVIESGVEPGEYVVIDGQLNLYHGAKIFESL